MLVFVACLFAEHIIKYAHLLFKGNSDLMAFTIRVPTGGGMEAGATAAPRNLTMAPAYAHHSPIACIPSRLVIGRILTDCLFLQPPAQQPRVAGHVAGRPAVDDGPGPRLERIRHQAGRPATPGSRSDDGRWCRSDDARAAATTHAKAATDAARTGEIGMYLASWTNMPPGLARETVATTLAAIDGAPDLRRPTLEKGAE